jgi:hypothetical protein
MKSVQKTAQADAELLALAASRAQLRARVDARAVDDPESVRLIGVIFDLAHPIAAMKARSIAGVLAKARIAVELAEMEEDPGLGITRSLVRDLEHLAGMISR